MDEYILPCITKRPKADKLQSMHHQKNVDIDKGTVSNQDQFGKIDTYLNPDTQDWERVPCSFRADRPAPKIEDFLIELDINDCQPEYHNNTTVDYFSLAREQGFSAETFFAELGSLMLNFRKIIAEKGGSVYDSLKDKGVVTYFGISIDKDYFGINLRVPFRAVLINPLAVISSTVPGLAYGYFNAIVNEIAHISFRKHDESFMGEKDRLLIKLAEDGTDLELRAILTRIIVKHKNLIRLLVNAYETSTPRNVGKSFDKFKGNITEASG